VEYGDFGVKTARGNTKQEVEERDVDAAGAGAEVTEAAADPDFDGGHNPAMKLNS
jgi:hypothetical protein